MTYRKIIITVSILLFPVFVYFIFDLYAEARLKSEIRKLEALGIRCRASQIVASIHPSPQPLLNEFNRLVKPLREAPLPKSDDPEEWKKFLAFLAENREAVNAADAFLDAHPLLTFPLRIPGNDLYDAECADLILCRDWIRFNNKRIEWELKEGNPETAAHLFDRNAVLRDYTSPDAWYISFLVALFCEQRRQQALFEAAANGQIDRFSPADLRRWQESMVPLEKKMQTAFPLAADSEIAAQIEVAYDSRLFPRDGELANYPQPFSLSLPIPTPLRLLDIARNGDWLRRYREAAALDHLAPDYGALEAAHRDYSFWRPVTWLLSPALLQSLKSACNEYGRYRTLRTGLAVELFLRKHGKLPETLEELVPEFLPEVPVSPFSGAPLQYERGKLERLDNQKKTIEFQGYRIHGGGNPEYRETGNGLIPAWNRSLPEKELQP